MVLYSKKTSKYIHLVPMSLGGNAYLNDDVLLLPRFYNVILVLNCRSF
jgi:hypothetical protein